MTKDECRDCSYVEYDEIDGDYWTCEWAEENIDTIDECPRASDREEERKGR